MLRLLAVILGLSVGIAGCTGFTARKETAIEDAIALQDRAIEAPLFAEILTELEAEDAIVWPGDSLKGEREDRLAAAPNETAWLLTRFEDRGGFKEREIGPWRRWTPAYERQAKTEPCEEALRLNKWMASQSPYRLANVLVNNRVRAFCYRDSETTYDRSSQMCDPAFVSGDLAEALVAHFDGRLRHDFTAGKMCPALCDALAERGIRSACDTYVTLDINAPKIGVAEQ